MSMEAEYAATGDETLGKALDRKWSNTMREWAIQDFEKKRPQFESIREKAADTISARAAALDRARFLDDFWDLLLEEAIANELVHIIPADLMHTLDVYRRNLPDKPLYLGAWQHMAKQSRLMNAVRRELGITVYEAEPEPTTPNYRSAADENRNEG